MAEGMMGQMKRQYVAQQAESYYNRNSKALYPLAPSIANGSFERFGKMPGNSFYMKNEPGIASGLYGLKLGD